MKNSIFEENPKLDCYFETSDGNPFYTENAAQYHAKDLEDKSVKAIYRKDFVEETETAEADTKAKEEADAKAQEEADAKAKEEADAKADVSPKNSKK